MRTYTRILLVATIPFFLLGLIGCGAAVPPDTSDTAAGVESAYPVYPAYPSPLDGNTRLQITSTRVVEVSTPQPDQATITGVIISERTDQPIVEVPVQLAGVYYEGERGAFVLDTGQSPIAMTDGQGRFAFVNVEAQDYVIVIGNVEVNDYKIIPEDSGRARVWTAVAGDVLDTGTHRVLLDSWE